VLGAIGLVAASVAATTALATAPSGVIMRTNLTPFPPGSVMADSWQVNADRIKFQTKDPTRIVVQKVVYTPGSDSGWHLHPGLVFVTVTGDGAQVTRWVGCKSTVYHSGQTFLENGEQPVGKITNNGAVDATLYAYFVVPQDSPLSDATPLAPQC
jgi:quercetin dioxygenase-like cupin family protein